MGNILGKTMARIRCPFVSFPLNNIYLQFRNEFICLQIHFLYIRYHYLIEQCTSISHRTKIFILFFRYFLTIFFVGSSLSLLGTKLWLAKEMYKTSDTDFPFSYLMRQNFSWDDRNSLSLMSSGMFPLPCVFVYFCI
jgi:hypothetical protein